MSKPPTNRVSRPLRFVRGLGLFLLLLLIAIPGWIMLSRGDAPEALDGDLLSEARDRRSGAAAHRTWALLGRAFADFDHGRAQEAIAAFREGDFSDAAWIRAEADRFSGVRARVLAGVPPVGAQADNDVALGDGHSDDGIMGLHSLTRVSAAHALWLSHEGRVEEAIEQAIFGLRAGHILTGYPDVDLIGVMISGSSQSLSLSALEFVVGRNRVTPDQAKRLTDEISARRTRREAWRQMWANEYFWARGLILEAFDNNSNPDPIVGLADSSWRSMLLGWIPKDYLVQPNRTLTRLSDSYRSQRDQTGRHCLSIHTAEAAEISAAPGLSLLVRPNPVGEVLVKISQPNFDAFELKRCRIEGNFVLAQVLIAVKAYADHEGQLPAEIAALVPDYLAAVPKSPFDGLPLQYSREERRVSVDGAAMAAVLGPGGASTLDEAGMVRRLAFGAGLAEAEPTRQQEAGQALD